VKITIHGTLIRYNVELKAEATTKHANLNDNPWFSIELKLASCGFLGFYREFLLLLRFPLDKCQFD